MHCFKQEGGREAENRLHRVTIYKQCITVNTGKCCCSYQEGVNPLYLVDQVWCHASSSLRGGRIRNPAWALSSPVPAHPRCQGLFRPAPCHQDPDSLPVDRANQVQPGQTSLAVHPGVEPKRTKRSYPNTRCLMFERVSNATISKLETLHARKSPTTDTFPREDLGHKTPFVCFPFGLRYCKLKVVFLSLRDAFIFVVVKGLQPNSSRP